MLRSDTVTRLSSAMLQAMISAPLGDDVMGDDPTVNRLQEVVAERAGKAAGLFLPSGTQSNLAGLMAHCERGDQYLVGQQAHTYKYEGGGAAVLGGGLRQSGVLAAACLYALEHNVERLAEDHANARLLAEGLRGIAGVRVLSQDTNMVFAQFEPARDALTAPRVSLAGADGRRCGQAGGTTRGQPWRVRLSSGAWSRSRRP